ncbi:MAG: NUDIX hydrolase [Acidimicrobiales bacterium]|jgi:8-oxo-dGTP pyrophosphatase MutT (NUDIX family)
MNGSTSNFDDDVLVTDFVIPRIPASAGALIADERGRILILKPTYKSGWTIPGGQLEEDGESPWEGCRREVLEETGLTVTSGRLACVDFLRPRARRPGGLRFLFDCGAVGGDQKDRIVLQAEEIEEYRWVDAGEAARRLSGPVGRRVERVLASTGPLYLEEGIPVAGVTG